VAKLHEYPVTVKWSGGRTGQGTVTAERTQVQNNLGVPPEFGGDGKPGTNPEELLASAIAGCYSVTYGIVAANRKLPVIDITTEAVGEVEEQGATFTYKKVTIRPRIVLSADADDAQMKTAEDFAHKADGYCIITNAVRGKVEIVLEPTIVRGE
jgi:peroxiredoxin-like protein